MYKLLYKHPLGTINNRYISGPLLTFPYLTEMHSAFDLEATPVPPHEFQKDGIYSSSPFSPKDIATPTNNFSPEPQDSSGSPSSGRRARRPPDLDLSPAKSMEMSSDRNHDVTVEPAGKNNTLTGQDGDFDPTRDSTPTMQSMSGGVGSTSEQVSLILKQNTCKLVTTHIWRSNRPHVE